MIVKNIPISVYSLNRQDWKEVFHKYETQNNALHFWLKGLYRSSKHWDKHISRTLINKLELDFDFKLPKITQILNSDDGTVKFQMAFFDNLEVETVLIPFKRKYTICLSTQVGCAMKCDFCYTGTQGLKRNLTSGEIVGQYLVAQKWLNENRNISIRSNIVFMGQGEPLHNFAALKKAIEIFNDTNLVDIGASQMTLSTVGFLPNLNLLHELPKINIALSLHSPFQNERSKLIPVNELYPLNEVVNSLDTLARKNNKITTYEYLLIKDFNMSDVHVEGLKNLLSDKKAIINLIPFNPFPQSNYKRPTIEEINNFKEKLVREKLRVLVRETKGDDILAACGQLKINKMARNYEHTT